jgi:hypothetical protein
MSPAFSLRRLVAASTALFLVILAFLAGRVHAGADPAQVSAPTSSAVQSEPAPDPYGGFAPGDPSQGSVPDHGTVPSPGGQDADPPVTQAS